MRDPPVIAAGGMTIEDRMKKICDGVATDMQECSKTCDAYSHKGLIVKVLAGPVWEGRLAGFADTFLGRKKEFQFALSIHTGVVVDDLARKMDNLEQLNAEMNERHALQFLSLCLFLKASNQIEDAIGTL
jgi:hypothetical protein